MEGSITILEITKTADEKFKFVIGEDISKKGAIPSTENSTTKEFFKLLTKEFIKK